MALRRAPTRPLGKMPILGADISVIVSEEPLEPVTATPADEEAVSKASLEVLPFFLFLRCVCVKVHVHVPIASISKITPRQPWGHHEGSLA